MPDPLPHHPRYIVAITLLAATAGLIDAVTYTAHGQVFASAMTGNIVLLGIALASRRPESVLLHIVPLASFILGVLLAKSLLHFHRSLSLRLTLLLQMAVLLVLGALPLRLPSGVIVAALALSSAMQVTAVRRIDQVPFNTTFMTGNLRSVVEGAFDSLFPADRPSNAPGRNSRLQFAIVGLTCFAFFLGAILVAALQPNLQDRTFLLAVILLGCAAVLLWRSQPPSLV